MADFLDVSFSDLLGAAKDLSKMRYEAKAKAPAVAEVMPAASTAVATRDQGQPAATVVDRLKSGDVVTWAMVAGTLVGAALVWRLAKG